MQKRCTCVGDAILGIQDFTLVFLLMCTKDLGKTVRFLFGVSEFGTEFKDCLLEARNLVV